MTAVGHPFDTIKVRLQCQSMEKPIYGEAPLCLAGCISSRAAIVKSVQCYVNARRMAAAQGLVWCTIACQRRASAYTCALLAHSSLRCQSLFKHQQSTCIYTKHDRECTYSTYRHVLCRVCCMCAAGVVDCAKKTVQWEGLPGLYKVSSTASSAGTAAPADELGHC